MNDPAGGERRALLRQVIEGSLETQQRLLQAGPLDALERLTQCLVDAFRQGHKVLIFGNGGSAADAQHVAAELVNRFLLDRQALPAIALTTNTSILTSVANDMAFEQLFARQVRALASPGDVVVGISTSGSSPNVLEGIAAARELGAWTVGFTGQTGGALKALVDLCFCAPSDRTPRIQEAHITAWHAVCEAVERELFAP
jgi:D-sedoheptulose 7-phosphate isomerase